MSCDYDGIWKNFGQVKLTVQQSTLDLTLDEEAAPGQPCYHCSALLRPSRFWIPLMGQDYFILTNCQYSIHHKMFATMFSFERTIQIAGAQHSLSKPDMVAWLLLLSTSFILVLRYSS